MNNYKISVIVPVYNDEQYLNRCLSSILCQTLKNIEILCVDDGSTDKSPQIIKEHSQIDKRVKYLSMSKNSGPGPARNKGLRHATGEYISFIDSDDFIIEKTAYEELYKFASSHQAEMVSANLKDYRSDNTLKINSFSVEIKNEEVISPKNYGIPWYFQKNLYKKSFLDKYIIRFPNYSRGQDPVFLTNVLVNLSSIFCHPVDFYAYTPPSTNKINSDMKEKDYIKHFKHVLSLLKSSGFEKIYIQYEDRLYKFIKRSISSNSLEENIKNIFGENSLYMDFYNSKKQTIPTLNKPESIKVSIIIPIYNVENYLRQCLDSVINQTLKEIEVICVNDGSTDHSMQILEEYTRKDERIKILTQENAGLAAARNTGLKHAKGEFIGFIDSDDWVDVSMFEKLYKNAKFHDSDMVMCPMQTVNEDYEKPINLFYYNLDCFGEEFNYVAFNYKETKEFILQIAVNAYNKIYKTEFITRINAKFPEGLIFEDNPFFYKCFLNAKKVTLVRDFLYFHRVNRSGSIIENADRRYFDVIEIKNLVKKQFLSIPDYKEYENDLLRNKMNGIFNRYFQVDEIYRPEFFELIKKDFNKMNVQEDDIAKFNSKNYYMYVMNSETQMEFELRVKNWKQLIEIKHLNIKNKKLLKQHKTLTTQQKKLTNQNKTLTTQQKKLTNQNKTLTTQQKKLTEQNKTLTTQQKKLTEQNKTLTTQQKKLTEQNKTLTTQQKKLTEQNKTLTTQQKKLTKSYNEALKQINKLTNQNGKLLKMIDKQIKSSTIKTISINLRNKNPYLFIFSKWNHSLKNVLINIKGYKAIKKNNLVEIEYYNKKNRDVKLSGINPIMHYIYFGFEEGRKPSPTFDADYYLKSYPDVKKSNLNPLVHYSLYGIKEGRRHQGT